MLKRILWFSLVIILLVLSSCNSEPRILCEINLNKGMPKALTAEEILKAKATAITTGFYNTSESTDNNGKIIKKELHYFVKISKTNRLQYHAPYQEQNETSWPSSVKNIPENFTDTEKALDSHWFFLDPDQNIALALSQGKWAFEAVAYLQVTIQYESGTGNNLEVRTEKSYLATPYMSSDEPEIKFINLNTRTVSVEMTAEDAPTTLVLNYTATRGYNVETYIVKATTSLTPPAETDWTGPFPTGYIYGEHEGEVLNQGIYYVKAVVKDAQNDLIFSDVSKIFVFPSLPQKLSGRFDVTGKTGISSQKDEGTGLDQALEETPSGGTANLVVNESFDVYGDPNDSNLKEPMFTIPDNATVTLDLDGKNLNVSSATFTPNDVLFHVDQRQTLVLMNNENIAQADRGKVDNTCTTNNGWGNNDLGAVIAIDGGTVIMRNLNFQGAIGGRAAIGAVNFVGCYTGDPENYNPRAVNDCHGGTLIIEDTVISSHYGITNVEPASDGKYNGNLTPLNYPTTFEEGTAEKPTIVTIILSNATIGNPSGTACISVHLTGNYTKDSHIRFRIVLDGTNNLSTPRFELTGIPKELVQFYANTQTNKNLVFSPYNSFKSIADYWNLPDANHDWTPVDWNPPSTGN